jgi:hypothetical protein
VGHALEEGVSDGGEELLDVDLGRGEEVLAEVLGRRPRAGGGIGEGGAGDNFTDEGEAVGVDAGGGETEEDVAWLDVGGREDEVSLDGSDGESGEVVVVW